MNVGRIGLAFLALAGGTLEAKFVNATASSKIDYVHAVEAEVPTIKELGLEHETVRLVSLQGGGAAIDANGDGWTDYLGARYNLPPVLYINQKDGTFKEEGAARGLGAAVDGNGFAAGDLDNDGDQDLVVVPHYGNRYFLLINDGSGNFTEEAVARGADLTTAVESHEGYSVGLVDYDLDGYLDVYVSEWGPAGPDELELHSVLLRNLGGANPGHFENVTKKAGLLQPHAAAEAQHGFSSAWADFDGDGWPDLYLVADFYSSQMYWNNGDGTFTESTDASGLGKEEFGMGVAVADYDHDGDLDLYVTSIFDQFLYDEQGSNHGNKFYENLGNRKFAEISIQAGVDRTGWGWGAAFFELDNNGELDLAATNGSDAAAWAIGSGGNFPNLPAVDDQTYIFRQNADARFFNVASSVGVADTGYGKGIVVLDYDNDGDEDLIITNTFAKPIVYKSDASESGNDWIRFKLEGRASNRDGIGAVISVVDGGVTRTALYNPTNAFLGQREGYVHFGLGISDGSVDSVTVRWPNGIAQDVGMLSVNTTHRIVEPDQESLAPVFTKELAGGAFRFGERFELSVASQSVPAAYYVWEKDGVVIEGEKQAKLIQKRFQPIDIGTYRVTAVSIHGSTQSSEVVVGSASRLEGKSPARLWNEFMLEAIRKDFPNPTVHGRNLYHVSAAMWDAFWAFEPGGWDRAAPLFKKEIVDLTALAEGRSDAQAEAISHAAFRVLVQRYAQTPGSARSLFGFRWLMERLGFDPDDLGIEGDSPAAVGNRIGFAVIEQALLDGSNESNGYADTSGYVAANDPLVFDLAGTTLAEPNRWQPLAFEFLVTQNGIPIGKSVQNFLGVNWREVSTYALPKPTPHSIGFDPGPPPLLGTGTEQAFRDSAVEVIRYSSLLDPGSSELIDISPGGRLNNSLGKNDGVGRAINPYTKAPYVPNWVKHADYGRVLAEFWADGPSSETPPGHWNALHNEISDHPLFTRRYGGEGEELPALEWDVRAYLALNGAMHDAAVAAWTLKRQYDYVRPVSIIRYLGGLGQSSDPGGPAYHAQGLPLVPGLIEVVTAQSSATGERHERLAAQVGKIAIRAWAGEPSDHHTEVGGVDWILAGDWMPYQRSTFVTPAFAAYVSGHSTFSRAAAEVMTLLTGSSFFPGGLGEFRFDAGKYLEFEQGPSEDFALQWATYYDAADQAGLSRLYGGIHVSADDLVGRMLGARVGLESFLKTASLGGMSGLKPLSGYAVAEQDHPLGQSPMLSKLLLTEQREKSLPVRRPADLEAFLLNPGAAQEGIYFVQEKDAFRGYYVLDNLCGLEWHGSVSGGQRQLALEFAIPSGEVSTILLRGKGASSSMYPELKQLADPKLRLYRIDGQGGVLIDQNDDWADHELASLSEAVALRSGLSGLDPGGKESAIVKQLGAGRYRAVMSGSGGSEGMGVLEFRAVVWTEDSM